jgi:transcriptional regulator GlxA family with amidase domain
MSYIRRFRTYERTSHAAEWLCRARRLLGNGTGRRFETANLVAEDEAYDLHFLSETGGLVQASVGVTLDTEAFSEEAFVTLVVSGATLSEPSTPSLLRFIKGAPNHCRRIASICTGAFVLAEAGFLDGRRVTTHWLYARELQARFPAVRMDEDRIFINDGPVWTSAGMTAGIDLALELVESDLGDDGELFPR